MFHPLRCALLLLVSVPLAASECRVASVLSGDGSRGSLIVLDAGSRYGLNPGAAATVLRFDAELGAPTPWAQLQVVESDEISATARVAASQGSVSEHMLVRFRPRFQHARAHGGYPADIGPQWEHEGGGSNADRRTILSTHAWPASRGRLYILDSVRVPSQLMLGTPLPVGVDYSAASPAGSATMGASLTLRLRRADGGLQHRFRGPDWRIRGGGGIGSWEGLLPLPGDLRPGGYTLSVGLGAPGAGPLVQVDLPVQIVSP